MITLFSDDTRRNPYPVYDHFRSTSPLLRDPQTGLWMVFDYDGVKRVLTDPQAFSSKMGPVEWMISLDPPRHDKLRALISQGFTPRSISNLEPRIQELTRQLLGAVTGRGEMDVAADFSVPLPMLVIGAMLGLPPEDRPRFQRWNDVILNMSYTLTGMDKGGVAAREFAAVTTEMNEYLAHVLEKRRAKPEDDLLTRLAQAELDGERLKHEEILGFFQLLLLAGSETTTNLINNAVLCFVEHPDQLARLRAAPELLPSAVEEVLRFRSPFQWMFRLATRDVELHGQTIPAGKVALAMMGSANRDPKQFPEPHRFDIARNPNAHTAFGHGPHFCLGAALARLEDKVALAAFLEQMRDFQLASSEPWEPRKGLHVHGPTRLPIRFTD